MPPIDGIGACALTNSEKNGVASVAVTSVYFASPRKPMNPQFLTRKSVLVAEAVGLPLRDPVHGHADRIALAVEHDVPLHRDAFGLVVDRHRLEAELVLPACLAGDAQIADLVILQEEVLFEVDARSGDAQRLAGNHHVGRGGPEAGEALDSKALTRGRVVDRPGLELGERGRGDQQQRRQYTVQPDRRHPHKRSMFPGKSSESIARRWAPESDKPAGKAGSE